MDLDGRVNINWEDVWSDMLTDGKPDAKAGGIKMSKQPPPARTAMAVGPCLTI